MRQNISMWLIGILYIAIIYLLVRPGSNGAQTVGTFFQTFADLVRGVTGETYDSSTNTWSPS